MTVSLQVVVGIVSICLFVLCDYTITRWAELASARRTLDMETAVHDRLCPAGDTRFRMGRRTDRTGGSLRLREHRHCGRRRTRRRTDAWRTVDNLPKDRLRIWSPGHAAAQLRQGRRREPSTSYWNQSAIRAFKLSRVHSLSQQAQSLWPAPFSQLWPVSRPSHSQRESRPDFWWALARWADGPQHHSLLCSLPY